MSDALHKVLAKIQTGVGRPERSLIKVKQIERTPEFLRISKIERRDWTEQSEYLAEQMSEILKTPYGEQKLRPVQASILHDLGVYGGAIGIIMVGGGKTLVCFLAPLVTQSVRPLLIVPGCLLGTRTRPGKTERDLAKYLQHWRIPKFIRIVSYEWLARKKQADFFDKYKPDLVMLDEGHLAKNTQAVVTQRIKFYRSDCIDYHHMQELSPEQWSSQMRKFHSAGTQYPMPKFLIQSGTLTKNTPLDYWHMLRWVMPPDNVPLPHEFPEVYKWSMCLGARVKTYNRVAPGALLEWCNEEEKAIAAMNPRKAARRAFKRRLYDTPGIVCSQASYEAASLRVLERRVLPPKIIRDAFYKLREYNETPGGHQIQDGATASLRAQELALGFYQVWDPPPPRDWLVARQEWCQDCRYILAYNRSRIVSEEQVKEALDAGQHVGKRTRRARERLAKWREISEGPDAFKPNVVPIWVDDFAVKYAAKWAQNNGGVVWTNHPAFGKRLAKLSGLPYYHSGGFDDRGSYIENHPHGKPMIASIRSNMTGKNLQFGWNKALMMFAPSSGDWWEQLLGRMHREGQPEDEVVYELFVSCIEHLINFWTARGEDAEYVEDSALKHKLMFADIGVARVEEVLNDNGSVWSQFDPAKGLDAA